MIESLRKVSINEQDNFELCMKQIIDFNLELNDDSSQKSEYLKMLKKSMEKLYSEMDKLEKNLDKRNIILLKFVEIEKIDEKIEKLKNELASFGENEFLMEQIKELEEQKKNLINESRMLSYE